MAQLQKDIIERAFEIAATGKCSGFKDVKSVLRSEGYEVNSLIGLKLQRDIQAVCRSAQGLEPKPPPKRVRKKARSVTKLPRSMRR